MSDTTNQSTDQTAVAVTPTTSVPPQVKASLDVDVALAELYDHTELLMTLIESVRAARTKGFFPFLSKPSRNQLLNGIVETAGNVDDAAKAAFRALKKIKRTRLPDEVADALLKNDTVTAIQAASSVLPTPESDDDES